MAQQIVADARQARFILHPPIHQAFRRAIVSRKECTAWYEQNTEGQWRTNEKHACMVSFYETPSRTRTNHNKADTRTDFTNILMTAWDILLRATAGSSKPESKALPPTQKGGMPKARTTTAEHHPSASTNRFAAFYIDADGNDDNDEMDFPDIGSSSFTDTPTKRKKSKFSYTATPTTIIPDEGQIEEEFWFAIQSFLQEQQRVREEVKGYWGDYKNNESHLVMATFGTRMAIDLIRRSEIELGLQVNRPARFAEAKYPVSAFPAMLVCTKLQDTHPFDAPLDGFFNVSSRLNELTLYNTYSTLKSWCSFLGGGFGYTVDKKLFSKAEIRRLIQKIAWVRSIEDYRLPYEDDITRGVKKAMQCGEVPIWTTFALRLLLDIEDILGACLFMPWQDASQYTLKHAQTPLTHWHHQSGCRHIPLAEETVDVGYAKERSVKKKPSVASKPTSMREKVRSLEGPRKKGMAKRRPAKKKTSKASEANEKAETCTCDACLRCGYDHYEKDVGRALEWVTDVNEGGMELPDIPFEEITMNPLHCGLMKYDLYRSRQA